MSFTVLSALFNLYAMRRGALVVRFDLRRVPRLLGGFIARGPVALYRMAARRSAVAEAS